MLKLAILAIWITGAICSEGESQLQALPKLPTPTNVRIAKDSDKSVIIRWNFEKPSNVSLLKVKFSIELASDGLRTESFFRIFRVEPYVYRVHDLVPATKYALTLKASSPAWQDSDNAGISFVTLETDYATPLISFIAPTKDEAVAEYLLIWSMPRKMQWLHHYDIEICEGRRPCLKISRGPEDSTANIPIEYDINFSVKVIAVYFVPDTQVIERPSKLYVGDSGPIPPLWILKNIRGEQDGNRVRLPWIPLRPQTGMFAYYDVLVREPAVKKFPDRLQSRPRLKDNSVYEFRSIPKEIDPEIFLTGDTHHWTEEQCRPRRGPLLVVMNRTESGVHFRIIFRQLSMTFGPPEDSDTSLRFLSLGSAAEAFGLTAYEYLRYRIRVCVSSILSPEDSCGNRTEFKTFSYVTKPSPVRNLAVHPSTNGTLIMITWKRPVNPNGPVSGYKLLVQTSLDDNIEETYEKHLPRSARSFTLERSDPRKTYKIAVSAFNLDLDDPEIKLHGNMVYVVFPDSGSGESFYVVLVPICGMALLFLAFLFFGRLARENRVAPDVHFELHGRPAFGVNRGAQI
ncbi:uncharacterized protein LOC100905270 [Galendromus occidentalis]|uniref:Uncharacterized protein LOC100905270 n=1 Tax=Galendromus occidentalis TaxID=34638 RepID=A0AAJ6QQ86_9ACAR|nr:uncharacterized protein LOC100905270 [Galendromus occidentalis]